MDTCVPKVRDMTDYSDEWEYQRKCIEALERELADSEVEISRIEFEVTQLEQDRMWRLLEQAARG